MRSPHHKYIRSSRWWGGILLVPGSEEVYDLAADPAESSNRVAEEPALAERYRSIADPYWSSWFTGPQLRERELPEHVLERLRSLGYVQ